MEKRLDEIAGIRARANSTHDNRSPFAIGVRGSESGVGWALRMA